MTFFGTPSILPSISLVSMREGVALPTSPLNQNPLSSKHMLTSLMSVVGKLLERILLDLHLEEKGPRSDSQHSFENFLQPLRDIHVSGTEEATY